MPGRELDVAKRATRRMKTHKKSRGGCGNCKVRKVKCDESKPMCKRCQVYGTFCNYDPQYSDLQPLEYRSGGFLVLQPSISFENLPVFGSIDTQASVKQSFSPAFFAGGYQFSARDLELLHHFKTRTLLTLGTGINQEVYRRAFSALVHLHLFLFHMVLTVTLMHERYLGIGADAEQATAVSFHWSQGAALMNSKLSCTIDPSEKDALWACAGMFGLLAFSSFDSKTPEESWPLNSSPLDLEWLKLCEGKKEIWKLVNPLREDSVFHSLIPNFLGKPSSCSDPKLRKLPPELFELCKLNDTTQQGNNPYLAPACFLAQTIDINCDSQNVSLFLNFFGIMQNNYKGLLKQKDSCALLLLAYWYAKMCQYRQWWVWPRTVLECQSICRYLRLYHGDDDRVLKALSFPEDICAAQSAIGMPNSIPLQ